MKKYEKIKSLLLSIIITIIVNVLFIITNIFMFHYNNNTLFPSVYEIKFFIYGLLIINVIISIIILACLKKVKKQNVNVYKGFVIYLIALIFYILFLIIVTIPFLLKLK